MAEPALQLTELSRRFGQVIAVDSVDLTVAQGEFVALLGPSGCGKTTTLNLIAGFTAPDAGSIRLQGRAVEGLPPFRRDVTWCSAEETPIKPLVGRLHFTMARPNWGFQLRFGLFEISGDDMAVIATAMGAQLSPA